MPYLTNRIRRSLSTTILILAALALASAGLASAQVTYIVTVDTHTVAGSTGFLDFQFNPGAGVVQSATAQILNFTTDGTLLPLPPALVNGNATGALPGTVTLVNSTALNEYSPTFQYGTTITFLLQLSGPAVTAPDGTATTDTSFFLLLEDSVGNPILTNSGSGAAGEVDILPSGSLVTTAFPNAGGGPSVVTFASPSTDAFQLSYAANLNIGDSVIDITNDGATGGNLCVNVYTFDSSEEMLSCCTCPVTPNGLASLSVNNSLLGNSLTGKHPSSAVVELVATTPGGGGACDATSISAFGLAPGMHAWSTTLHAVPGGTYRSTETSAATSALSTAELSHLASFCGFINSVGSGQGICGGCGTSALGASTKL